MIDFNDAGAQSNYELIPANTLAKARFVIKGGNDPIDNCITHSKNGDTSYLDCEFIILEGKYAKRKIFDKIGLSGNDNWVIMGRARIRAILESAKGINPKDISEIAQKARTIESFADLNNLDVVIKIGIEHDKNGVYPDKNRVLAIITPEHISYSEFMIGQDIPWSL